MFARVTRRRTAGRESTSAAALRRVRAIVRRRSTPVPARRPAGPRRASRRRTTARAAPKLHWGGTMGPQIAGRTLTSAPVRPAASRRAAASTSRTIAPANSSPAGGFRAPRARRPASRPTPRTSASAASTDTGLTSTAAPSAGPCPGSRRRRLRHERRRRRGRRRLGERHRLGEHRRHRAGTAVAVPATPSMCQTATRITTTTNERI